MAARFWWKLPAACPVLLNAQEEKHKYSLQNKYLTACHLLFKATIFVKTFWLILKTLKGFVWVLRLKVRIRSVSAQLQRDTNMCVSARERCVIGVWGMRQAVNHTTCTVILTHEFPPTHMHTLPLFLHTPTLSPQHTLVFTHATTLAGRFPSSFATSTAEESSCSSLNLI